MTLDDLIDTLNEIRAHSSGDRPVLVGIQPSWPLALHLSGVADGMDLDPDEDVDGMDLDPDEDADETQEPVWLAVSDSHPSDRSPYAPRSIWEVAQ